MSKPVVDKTNKLQMLATTLERGNTRVIATVTFKDGSKKEYKNKVYVTEPSIEDKTLTLLGPNVGSNRQQLIDVKGVSKYSVVTWSNTNDSLATIAPYTHKAALWGLNNGNGTIKVKVDGKTMKVKYSVVSPTFKNWKEMVIVGKSKAIPLSGIDGIPVIYTSRNTNVAKVDETGKITGVKAGVTYIDVTIGAMIFHYRIDVGAKGMKTIINRANTIVNTWKYNQGRRMEDGYYDCSSLVWKGYKAYNYEAKLGSTTYALTAAGLFDYLNEKGQIVSYGYLGTDLMNPGDLIFYGDYDNAVKYSTPGRTLDIYHVAMYAGKGMVVEKGGQTINYNNTKYIVGIGRVVK